MTASSIAQAAYLKASNTGAGDNFGYAVAVSGDTVVVGARSENSSAIGVNGDQSDNSAPNSGAVYVFVRSGTTWSQQAYLKASNTDESDYFGYEVAVFGDTVVVGARDEDSSATGANGDQSDNSAPNSGAVYVFVRSGTTWSQQAYLKASNTEASDSFGLNLAIWEDTLVVGAHREDSGATGVNGDQGDNSSSDSGAAYVFVRNGTTWSQQAYLKASNTESLDDFALSVAVWGDTVVVGARKEDSQAVGVNGDESDNSAFDAGAAYVFTRSGTTWTQQAYLKASNTDENDRFGGIVAVSNDTLVVGAYLEDSNATGANGDQSDNSTVDSGAVYVFVQSGGNWVQQAYIKASNTDPLDRFGLTLSVSDDTLLVGAYLEKSNATGVNGDQLDNNVAEAGAAYFFTRNEAIWTQMAYLKASNTDTGDNFGRPISVSGDTVVAGAYPEDSSATGLNGNQDNNDAFAAGAAYVFKISDIGPTAWSDQGCALGGVFGDPLLVGIGTLVAGSNNSIDLSNAAPNALAGFIFSLSSTPVPYKGGTLKPFPFLLLVLLTTDATGAISIPFEMPAGIPPGTELWTQWAIQDVAAISAQSLSNAILGLTP